MALVHFPSVLGFRLRFWFLGFGAFALLFFISLQRIDDCCESREYESLVSSLVLVVWLILPPSTKKKAARELMIIVEAENREVSPSLA